MAKKRAKPRSLGDGTRYLTAKQVGAVERALARQGKRLPARGCVAFRKVSGKRLPLGVLPRGVAGEVCRQDSGAVFVSTFGPKRRSSRPLRGRDDHATAGDFRRWAEKAKTMTIAQLEYSRKDAVAAARAAGSFNPEREGRYMDEAMTYGDELRRRRARR